jgi:hypothetical protein
VSGLAFILSVLLTLPELSVSWSRPGGYDAVMVSVRGFDQVSEQCFKSGLELRYRYELRVCRTASFWYDRCGSNRIIMRSSQWDPTHETFKVITDRLGDAKGPEVVTYSDPEEARKRLSLINEVKLGETFASDADLLAERRRYLQVRLLTQCKGVSNQTVERLSYFLSLGMVRTNGFDSGWISFNLDQPAPGQ